MSSTEGFFESLRTAFAPQEGSAWIPGVLVCALLIAAAALILRARSRRSARRELHQATAELGREKGISGANVAQVLALADRTRVSPVDIIKHLAAFERATARELAASAPKSQAVRGATVRRIAELRRALGFDVLPPDHWLSTTRELKPGDLLQAAATRFEAVEVTEASLTLRLEAAAPLVVGTGALALEVIRPHDARYAVRCRVLDSFAVPGEAPGGASGHRVVLAHDEQPQRIQQREFVRVRVARPMSFVSMGAGPGSNTRPRPVAGRIVDVSAGGMSFEAPAAPSQGVLYLCSFELGPSEAFRDLAAIVLDSAPLQRGAGFQVRVAFTGLSIPERERLAAQVAWQQQRDAQRLSNTEPVRPPER